MVFPIGLMFFLCDARTGIFLLFSVEFRGNIWIWFHGAWFGRLDLLPLSEEMEMTSKFSSEISSPRKTETIFWAAQACDQVILHGWRLLQCFAMHVYPYFNSWIMLWRCSLLNITKNLQHFKMTVQKSKHLKKCEYYQLWLKSLPV